MQLEGCFCYLSCDLNKFSILLKVDKVFYQLMIQQHSLIKLFLTTKYYLYFSILQLLLSLVLLTLILFVGADYTMPLEITISLLLLSDIIIKVLSDDKFIRKLSNVIDIIILLILVVFIFMEFTFKYLEETLGQIGSVMLGMRYALQIYRIYSLIKQSRELRMMHDMGEIRLDNLDFRQQIDVYHQEIRQPKAL